MNENDNLRRDHRPLISWEGVFVPQGTVLCDLGLHFLPMQVGQSGALLGGMTSQGVESGREGTSP